VERLRIWATADGRLNNWISSRVLDPDFMWIDFRQEVSPPPVASMRGSWVIEPVSETESRIWLLHHYRAVNDDPVDLARIDQAVDSNSRTELAALKAYVERLTASADLTFSFEDSVQINGSATDVFTFINEAGRWVERLPHVAAVRLEEGTPGLQTLEMDTRAKDGSTHTTKSYRVCLPPHKIAYKQVTLPPVMSLHTGYWSFQDNPTGVLASSQHTVVLNPDNIVRFLAEDAGITTTKELVQSSLSANSRATLGHAKTYAEGRR